VLLNLPTNLPSAIHCGFHLYRRCQFAAAVEVTRQTNPRWTFPAAALP
jgi:hypothetical protein